MLIDLRNEREVLKIISKSCWNYVYTNNIIMLLLNKKHVWKFIILQFIFKNAIEMINNARFYNFFNKFIVVCKMLINASFVETKSDIWKIKMKNKIIAMLNAYKKIHVKIHQIEWNLNNFKNLVNETT